MHPQMLSTVLRTAARRSLAMRPTHSPLIAFTQTRLAHNEHAQESFESFNERYVSFFQSCQDLFELQRGLNNCFAHDLVPAPSVIEAALRAARRVDDYATAVRIFEGVQEKVENKVQYKAYMEELRGVRDDLGVLTKEELYNL